MNKPQVVLDTNVLISAAFGIASSTPDQIHQALKSQKFILVTSPEILEEIEEVINRKKIIKRAGMDIKARRQFMLDLIDIGFIVSGNMNVQVVNEDPGDDKFIAAALEANADYIVSGDQHLLKLKEYREIKIVSPADFVKIIEK